MRYLIVGGVAGGMSTAARLRRLDEKAEIIVFERGEYVSYANCGLPYYIGGTISERQSLLVQTPEAFRARFNVDVRTQSEVVKIDRAKQTVTVKDVKTGKTSVEKYDTLVLSPGAEPVKPPIPGIDHPNIFTLRSIPDTDRIKKFVGIHNPRRALIVGAGFIGLEMAENLHKLGVFVTIVEMTKQVMNVVDYEIAAAVHQHLKTKGVEFYLGDGVASFAQGGNNRVIVTLNSGRKLEVDMVLLSIGIRPETSVAKEAGIELGERGGIKVNEYLQTSDPKIYAVGDAIETYNPIIKKYAVLPLAGPANKQGRVAADNIAGGIKRKFNGVIGTAIAKVFDLTVATAGAPEKLLQKENVPYTSSVIHVSSHAGYYPGALPMTIKIQFAPKDGKLLGAQIVGYDGVDKRIDVFSWAIQDGKTVYDLAEFEHAYAPPYSSAKDPVNMSAFVAENILEGRMKVIDWSKLLEQNRAETVILDVRTKDENALGAIDGALNIPVDDLRSRLKEVPKGKKIVVYCGVGLRAYIACRILMQNGFKEVYNLSGGYKTYELAMQKQDNGDVFEGYTVAVDDLIHNKPAENLQVTASRKPPVELNACGLQCPGPIMRVKQEMDKLNPGERLVVQATDQGFYKDVGAWARTTGNLLVSLKQDKGIIEAVVEKGSPLTSQPTGTTKQSDSVTLIVFDNDLDKTIASFIIANGALAMGKKVNMFFTFWGLNVLRKAKRVKVKKNFIERMFGGMMPRGTKKLALSQMNMMGIGPKMIRGLMKQKGVDSLETMIRSAIQGGANIIACQMSMDLMGIKAEELIEGVNIGGVATYLEHATQSYPNLFI